MSRPPFEAIYMKLALMMAKRSTCERLQVGCVITTEDFSNVLGIGYNGNAKGFPNKCSRSTPGNCGDLHAEDNALLKVNSGPEIAKIAFITHQPCEMCAKRLVNKGGFKKVYYLNPYRLTEGLDVLKFAGIEVIKLEEEEV
jgi:dCMP deaminase